MTSNGERPPARRLLLGAAVLAGEKLHLTDGPPSRPMALLVGLAARGREIAAQAVTRAAKAMPRAPQFVRGFLDETGRKGARTIHIGRHDAAVWLKTSMDDGLAWAERSVIPKVIDDMTPKLMSTIRQTILPQVIDDLAKDDRIRSMISEQSQGMVSDATGELRESSAKADDRVESAFRRVFNLTPGG